MFCNEFAFVCVCSVRTELTQEGANSSLLVARIGSGDAGNYTCSVSAHEFATVTVHVLNGEDRSYQSCKYWLHALLRSV